MVAVRGVLKGKGSPACSAEADHEPRHTQGGEVFVDLDGPMHVPSLGGSNYVMICVDDFTRFKIVSFLKKKSDTADALKDVIADYIKPAGLDISAIRTDEGGEFEGEFQRLLVELSIKHEHTPPDTP